MTMEYIRRTYGVPAKRGGKVKFNGTPGVITSARGAYLRVLLNEVKHPAICHPRYCMEYIDPPEINAEKGENPA